jgi:hypothetical protein
MAASSAGERRGKNYSCEVLPTKGAALSRCPRKTSPTAPLLPSRGDLAPHDFSTSHRRSAMSASRRFETSQMRKLRSCLDGAANRSSRPIPALKERPYERAVSARERTLAEDVGCARRGGSSRCSSPTFSVSAAPAQVRRELHDLADRSPATCATCDLRHSADLKNVPHAINAPNLTKKRRLKECA